MTNFPVCDTHGRTMNSEAKFTPTGYRKLKGAVNRRMKTSNLRLERKLQGWMSFWSSLKMNHC